MKWPQQRADPWTVHVGIASGMAYRLRVHRDGRTEWAAFTMSEWAPMDARLSMDIRIMREATWTPPLPEGVRLEGDAP